jgi:hypothetical protein
MGELKGLFSLVQIRHKITHLSGTKNEEAAIARLTD